MARPHIVNDVQACLELQRPEHLPVFLVTPPFDLRVRGWTHTQYATDAEKIADLHSWAVDRFDYDWSFVHVDSCVALEPLGVDRGRALPESTEPWTPHPPLACSQETLESLNQPDPQQDGRMPLVLEAITRLKERFGDTLFVCGHVTAPFSSVAYLYGATEALLLLRQNPDLMQHSLEFMTEVQLNFAKAQITAGADGIWIGDLNSGSVFISLEDYRAWAFPAARSLIDGITAAGSVSFYHQNEKEMVYIAETAKLIEKGRGALSIGQGADFHQAYRMLGQRVALSGGLDPWDLLQDPGGVEQDLITLVRDISDQGGHILNSNAQVAVETDTPTVEMIVRTARETLGGVDMNPEQEARDYWVEQMDAAAAFMEQLMAAPVAECAEPMASLVDAVREAGVEVAFSDTLLAGQYKRQFYLRRGLIDCFLGVCREMNESGWILKVEDAYRSVAMQKALGQDRDIFSRVLGKVIWEAGAKPTVDLLFRRLSVLVAAFPKTGTHMSGSAIDISVLHRDSDAEVDRGGPYLEMSERTPMASPIISDVAQSNRREISAMMSRWGFAAYPYEFWHYSQGDAIADLLEPTDPSGAVDPARYGAISFDPQTLQVDPLENPLQRLHSREELEALVDRALA